MPHLFVSQKTNDFETLLRTFLCLTKHQILPCRFDHLFSHSLHLVDLQNALDLHQQAVNDPKVATCNAHNCGQSLSIGKVIFENYCAPELVERCCRAEAACCITYLRSIACATSYACSK